MTISRNNHRSVQRLTWFVLAENLPSTAAAAMTAVTRHAVETYQHQRQQVFLHATASTHLRMYTARSLLAINHAD